MTNDIESFSQHLFSSLKNSWISFAENYILMNESQYAELQNEISSLQRRLLAMNEIADGKSSEYKGSKDLLKRFKK